MRFCGLYNLYFYSDGQNMKRKLCEFAATLPRLSLCLVIGAASVVMHLSCVMKVHWYHEKLQSNLQCIVALSTCEAEYVALATATQEAKFLRQLLADLTCLPCKSVCIYRQSGSNRIS